jgi:hypothetical protein
MTWYVPYQHGRLMSAMHTLCSHCGTTDSMQQAHTHGSQQEAGDASSGQKSLSSSCSSVHKQA